MKLSAIIKLCRSGNLLMLIYLQVLLKFLVFKDYELAVKMDTFEFILFTTAMVLITAGGYVFNDINDYEADSVNKPDKVILNTQELRDQAKRLYIALNSIGILLGGLTAMRLESPSYGLIFALTTGLLYYYTKKLQGIALVGNLTIALLAGLSVALLPLMDTGAASLSFKSEFGVLMGLLIIFSVLLTAMREITKDISDINGDKKMNYRTLPIIIGRRRSCQTAGILGLMSFALLLFLIFTYSDQYQFTMLYLLVCVALPLSFVIVKLFSMDEMRKLNKINGLIKIIMFMGINALIIFSINN